MNPKTKRRILIALAACVLVAAAVTVVVCLLRGCGTDQPDDTETTVQTDGLPDHTGEVPLEHDCVDGNQDYECDRCGDLLEHPCKDGDGDHICDYCFMVMAHDCIDQQADSHCDICLQVLEQKNLVSLDYDRPLAGAYDSRYAPYPVKGSVALTAKGQTVVEMLDISGIQ